MTPCQTRWVMVPDGLRVAVAFLTKRPVVSDLFTVRALPVPRPTRSLVVVVRGPRRADALLTNLPVRPLLLTVRAIGSRSLLLAGASCWKHATGM